MLWLHRRPGQQLWRRAVSLMVKLSIIIPTLNEAAEIEETLQALQTLRQQGHQLIVTDGGSVDKTVTLATPLVDLVIHAPKGRARQMNTGVQHASGELLLFLHADTLLPLNSIDLISEAIKKKQWGRFDVQLSGRQPLLRLVEFMMNWRSRLSGIATGDQAIFVQRELFEKIGGYADIPLMEDIELSKRLKHHGRPACINTPLITSSRRWEAQGILNTILLMWRLRLAYFLGASPEQLIKRYQ